MCWRRSMPVSQCCEVCTTWMPVMCQYSESWVPCSNALWLGAQRFDRTSCLLHLLGYDAPLRQRYCTGSKGPHRDVVADQVPVALGGVELGCKAPHVAQPLRAVTAVRHQRETHGCLGLHVWHTIQTLSLHCQAEAICISDELISAHRSAGRQALQHSWLCVTKETHIAISVCMSTRCAQHSPRQRHHYLQ